MTDKSRQVSELLQPKHGDLQTVLSKVRAINTLNHAVQAILPAEVQKYCRVGNLSGGVLVLLVDNSAVATSMKYRLAELLAQLRGSKALRHIKEIQLKVRPPEAVEVRRGASSSVVTKVNWLSPETAETLKAMAESMTDDVLREVMLRIAGKCRTVR